MVGQLQGEEGKVGREEEEEEGKEGEGSREVGSWEAAKIERNLC